MLLAQGQGPGHSLDSIGLAFWGEGKEMSRSDFEEFPFSLLLFYTPRQRNGIKEVTTTRADRNARHETNKEKSWPTWIADDSSSIGTANAAELNSMQLIATNNKSPADLLPYTSFPLLYSILRERSLTPVRSWHQAGCQIPIAN